MAAASRAREARGEFAFLARLRAAVATAGKGRGVVVGIGDDCAVVELPSPKRSTAARSRSRSSRMHPAAASRLLLTTDTMVEGVHFRRDWLTARELGVRAWRAASSDIAAMGARPLWALLSLELPVEKDALQEADTLALVRGLATDARRCGCTLVGGNVSGGEGLSLTVTVIGETRAAPLLRSGARAGDLVFVSGAFGGAAAGWRALASASARGKTALRAGRAASAAWRLPPSRIEFAARLAERGLLHSAIDVSDGLVQDLGHLAEESGVAIRIDAASVPVHRAALALEKAMLRESLPRAARPAARDTRTKPAGSSFALELALAGGEDYELAFSAPAANWPAIERVAAASATAVMPIGIVERGPARVTDTDGHRFRLDSEGFDHLRRGGTRERSR